jgi:hypothetical protein
MMKASGYELIKHESSTINLPIESPEIAERPRRSFWGIVQAFLRKPEKKPSGDVHKIKKVIQAGDILTFAATSEALSNLWITIGLDSAVTPRKMNSREFTHQLVEVVVAPGHPAVGRLVSQLPWRKDPPYLAKIVAISRDGVPPEGPLSDIEIHSHDVAILEVEDNFFYETRNESEFLLTRRLKGYAIQRTERATISSIITVTMVLFAAFGLMSMLNAALLAVGAMLLSGCISIKAAWRSIEWETMVVLGAAIGLEAAVTQSGLSDTIANGLAFIGGDNPYIALAVVFLGAVFMTNVITNAAAAAFMFPIAISMSAKLGVNYMPFIIILMLGTSYAFINPAGYQTNMMVQTPGGYKFMDYVKVGLPLTIITGIVAIILAPLVYRF